MAPTQDFNLAQDMSPLDSSSTGEPEQLSSAEPSPRTESQETTSSNSSAERPASPTAKPGLDDQPTSSPTPPPLPPGFKPRGRHVYTVKGNDPKPKPKPK